MRPAPSVRRIVVATDLSANARVARRRAERLAHAVGAEVHLVYVTPEPDPAAALAVLPDEIGDLEALRLLLEAAEQTGERARGGAIQASFRCRRQPAVGILEAAREVEADLIAMGTHGRAGLRRWALGSVAEGVVQAAPCPVIAVREGVEPAPERPRRLLVAADLSARTPPLVAHARALAALTGAQLDLVHVARPPKPLLLRDGFRAALPARAADAEGRLRALGGDDARCVLLVGDPARELVRFAGAHHADLVLVATDRGGALGGVTARLLQTAPCPVLSIGASAAQEQTAGRTAVQVAS